MNVPQARRLSCKWHCHKLTKRCPRDRSPLAPDDHVCGLAHCPPPQCAIPYLASETSPTTSDASAEVWKARSSQQSAQPAAGNGRPQRRGGRAGRSGTPVCCFWQGHLLNACVQETEIRNRGFNFLVPIGRTYTQHEEKNDASVSHDPFDVPQPHTSENRPPTGRRSY